MNSYLRLVLFSILNQLYIYLEENLQMTKFTFSSKSSSFRRVNYNHKNALDTRSTDSIFAISLIPAILYKIVISTTALVITAFKGANATVCCSRNIASRKLHFLTCHLCFNTGHECEKNKNPHLALDLDSFGFMTIIPDKFVNNNSWRQNV